MSRREPLKPVDFLMTDEELARMRFPAGVVRADIAKQMRGRDWLSEVRYYYRDREFTCRECGRVEVWTTDQQKLWYEEWGGHPSAVAVHCRKCRLKRKQPENRSEEVADDD